MISITADVKESHGLCMTCNNAPNCFHRARRGPALFCELFDDYAPPVIPDFPRTEKADDSTPYVGLHVREADADTYVGLCMNCENRRTCGHSKPAGGVWHCENYR